MPDSRLRVILCMYKGLPNYNKYTKDFPVQSELRKKKLEKLKSQLATQQSIFTKPNTRGEAAKVASYRVCHILGLFCFKALPD